MKPWLLLTITLAACTSFQGKPTQVTLAHSSGGPAPIMTFVTVHADGRLELQEGRSSSWGQIHILDAAQIIRRVHDLEDELRRIKPLAEQHGCCDREEVYVRTANIELTIPVRYTEIVATTPKLVTSEHYMIPKELSAVLGTVEVLVHRAFGRRLGLNLTPSRDD